MLFQTEHKFILPKGYIDAEGQLHRDGVMRLATAADEIIPLKDPRVQQNPSYITIILLARVITKLGDVPSIDTRVIEKLFTVDLAFLQDFYQAINGGEPPAVNHICPHCNQTLKVPVIFD